MADRELKFVANLDVKGFVDAAVQAKGSIQELGDSKNITGLIEGLVKANPLLATLGATAFLFKEALDLTMEAEHIQMVEKQFELLGTQAGIATDELKKGLEKASLGLVDTSALLEVANKSIATMGGSASRLPEIMTLATKITTVFGGTAKDTFEGLTQAISMGNERMLKHYGIVVDTEKAVEDFAAANGLVADELSDAGKKQAIMNAALSQAKAVYKDITPNLKSATNTIELMKVSVKELGEIFTLVFEKTIGPTVRSVLSTFEQYARYAKQYLGESVADATDKSKKDISSVTQKIQDEATKQDAIENGKIKKDIVNHKAKAANDAAFKAELAKIDDATFKLQLTNINKLDQIDQMIKTQRLNRERQQAAEIAKIQANSKLTETKKLDLVAATQKKYTEQAKKDARDEKKLRDQMLADYAKNADGAFDGIARSFQAHSLQQQQALLDFNARGEAVFQSFQTNAVSAFQAMGASMAQGKDIASATADAMKSIFLNMIADRAQGEGTMLLLSGIWPPNPLALGAGAGLIALSGALRSLAGGSGSSSITGSVGGSSSSITGGVGVATTSAPNTTGVNTHLQSAVLQQQFDLQTKQMQIIDNQSASQFALPSSSTMSANAAPQKHVTIAIAGNYFNTAQTQKTLMDMIRQETDATDFSYLRIGQAS